MRTLLCLLLTLATVLSAADNHPASLDALFEEYWAFEMREDPFSATSSGNYAHNDQVPQVAPKDFERRNQKRQQFLAALEQLKTSELSTSQQLNVDLLHFILSHDINQAAFKPWRVPVLADGGFHSNIGYTVGATPFRQKKDYEDYLQRLRALPGYLAQNVSNMRIGLKDGFTQPKAILPTILPSFEAQVTKDADSHPLFRPFVSMNNSLTAEEQQELIAQARKIIQEQVIPAYHKTLLFMQEDYLPGAVDRVGAQYLPNGKAYYETLIRYYTTLDDATADAIHETGLREVARIRAEMNDVIAQTDFDGSFEQFVTFLRSDDQFYASNAEELLKEAAYISKRIDGRLPAFFGKLPRQPYSVEPVPDAIAKNYTTGRYVPAPPGSDRGGQYWVNTYALDTRPLYQLAALSLHEAVPGHHFQISLSYEIDQAPEFRTQFYPHAFGEGWGLYAEKLGVEMGIYDTPFDHFGRLSYEMWRACRLVIDTGLHDKGWSREQAMDYLASNTALSLHNVQTEVDRYISWPGQALAYKMGELTLWELRREAEAALGERFDIRTFHDAVLVQGGLPLEMLRDQIDAYIESHR